MGWTTVVNNFDWSKASTLAEYTAAINERAGVVSGTPVSTQSIGNDVQAAAFVAGLQNAILDLLTSFLDSTTYAAGFEGETDFVAYTLSSWKTASGLTSGFRRTTSMPTDWTSYSDAAFSYGICQAGDRLGPWIWKDLQSGLNILKWTLGGYTTWVLNGDRYAYATAGATYADNQSAVETAWPTAGGRGITNIPLAWGYTGALGMSNYGAEMWRVASLGRYEHEDTLARAVDFYTKFVQYDEDYKTSTEFNASDWGVGEGELLQFSSEAATSDTTVTSSSACGTTDLADWPSSNPGCASATAENAPSVVLKWSFAYAA